MFIKLNLVSYTQGENMRVDLHNHTTYCNHASGSIESYLQRAKSLGIDIFGFSCHAPMHFDEKYRMSFLDMPDYLAQIPKSYESVEVLRALEVDYILGREDLLDQSVLHADVDYLIGSVHFLDDWGFDNPEFLGKWQKIGVFATWDKYLSSLQSMAKTGYFQIVGHFDLPKLFGDVMPQSLNTKMLETLQIIKDMDMVLEVNAAGLRKNIKEQYPSYEILKKAKEMNIHITMGSDAHDTQQVGFGYETCIEILRDIGFDKLAIFRNKKKFLVDLG